MSDREGLEGLPPLRDVIRATQLSARHSLGQNFLLDLNITRRIARSGGGLDGIRVLEIGPGPGGLTRALLIEGAEAVVAVERDRRFASALSQIQQSAPDRLEFAFDDALSLDYPTFASRHRVNRVIANLPYNIATPLITGWLTTEQWPPWFDKLIVMLQLEVAQRMVAKPGEAAYGRLSILGRLRSTAKIMFTLPPKAFTPSPKVSSALVAITPVSTALQVDVSTVEAVTAAAFGQRRKMLRSSLGSLGVDTAILLDRSNIDPTARAETLAVDDFIKLARVLTSMRLSIPRS